MSKMHWTLMAIAALGLASPAAAQLTTGGYANSEAECVAQFRTADHNGDGVLSRSEISSARGLIPTSLSTQTRITGQDFMNACIGTVNNKASE